jgi:hypothetical protein
MNAAHRRCRSAIAQDLTLIEGLIDLQIGAKTLTSGSSPAGFEDVWAAPQIETREGGLIFSLGVRRIVGGHRGGRLLDPASRGGTTSR